MVTNNGINLFIICEHMIRKNKDITNEEWYPEYVKSILGDNIYSLKMVIPEGSNIKATEIWNKEVEKIGKYKEYIIPIFDTNYKLEDLVETISSNEAILNKLVASLSEKSEKGEKEILSDITKLLNETKEDTDADFYKKAVLMFKDITSVTPIPIPASNIDVEFNESDDIKSTAPIEIKNNDVNGGEKLAGTFDQILEGIDKIIENDKPVKIFDKIINPFEFDVEDKENSVNQEYTVSEDEKEAVKTHIKKRYDSFCKKIEKDGGIEKVSEGEKNSFKILDMMYNDPQKNVLDSKANAILNLLEEKGIKFRKGFSVTYTSTKNNMLSAKTIYLVNVLGDLITYNEDSEIVYNEDGNKQVFPLV